MASQNNAIRGLNIRLRNSFETIKQDMQDLKQSQMASLRSSKEIRNEVVSIKENFTSKDKFNVLKIKLGGLNEDMKKLGKVEKDLDKLKETSAKKDNVEKQLSEFKKDLKAMDKQVETAATEKQLAKLIEEVNSEFDLVKDDLNKLDKKGGKAAELMVERDREKNQVVIDELKAKIQGMKQSLNHTIKKSSVESLVGDINVEFDDVKENIETVESDIKHMATEIKSLQKEAAMKKRVDEKFKEVRVEMGDLKAELEEEFLKTRKLIKKLDIKSSATPDKKNKEDLKKELMKAYKIKPSKTAEGKKKGKGLLITSNILIALAFASLGGSIVTYFLDYIKTMDICIIAAIALFVVGVVMRVVAIMRETQ